MRFLDATSSARPNGVYDLFVNVEAKVTQQAAWHVLPSIEELDELLGHDPVAALLGLARSRAPVETGYTGDPGSDPEVRVQFELAQKTAKKLRLSVLPTLTPEEEQALHAFVHLVARPALRVHAGAIAGIPDHWKKLSVEMVMVMARIRGVGRVDTWDGQHTGTAWFVTPSLLLTNKHVVAQLCGLDVQGDPGWCSKVAAEIPKANAAWAADPKQRPMWDPGDAPSTEPAPGTITKIRAVHADLDMGLLEIDGVDGADLTLPLSATGPTVSSNTDVYLAGYPAVFPNHNIHPALAKLLFAGAEVSRTKRLSPGQLIELVDPMPIATNRPRASHNGSTLGGSSGSPVIDFDSHRVIALHFSGQYGHANYAVPLWLVKDDPFFTANGIVFG